MSTIAENLKTILDIKSDIKSAIENKGVTVADTDSFATYPSKIAEIETGGGTGGDGFDFTVIGYSSEENTAANDKIEADIAYSKSLYDEWDNTLTDATDYFSRHINLVYCPNIDTSNILNMSSLFYGCYSLTTIFPMITTRVINMSSMFQNCYRLKNIPQLDTSNVSDATAMFQNCLSLQSIPLLDFGNVTSVSYMFGYSDITTLTDLGGFKNLKINWNDNYGLNRLPNLTYESVMNVINNLYDFPANGSTETRTIKFDANSITLLSDEDIAIATNRGWTIS